MIIASNISLLTPVFVYVLSLMCGFGTEPSNIKTASLLSMGFAPDVVYIHKQQGNFLLLITGILTSLMSLDVLIIQNLCKDTLVKKRVGANYSYPTSLKTMLAVLK